MTPIARRKPIRLGILGGSFDPPHIGHLIVAQTAVEQLKLEKVIFLPAHRPPHKLHKEQVDALHRLRMTRLATRQNSRFVVSDLEVRKKGVSYTVETLRILRRRHPSARFFLILGADSLAQFQNWHSPQEIARLASLVVYPRTGRAPGRQRRLGHRIQRLEGPLVHVSSSKIRALVGRRRSIRFLVPFSVERYIKRHRLYVK